MKLLSKLRRKLLFFCIEKRPLDSVVSGHLYVAGDYLDLMKEARQFPPTEDGIDILIILIKTTIGNLKQYERFLEGHRLNVLKKKEQENN